MTFRSLARRRGPRWVALLAILLITGMLASTSALAITFSAGEFISDVGGQNDEPGQKDLTAQASKTDPAAPNHFYTAWKWDDTAWSGNNTGDGCSLFDTDVPKDGLVNYAACATVKDGGVVKGTDTEVTLDTVTFYSCNNKWDDRCGNPVQLLSESGLDAETYCTVTDLDSPGQFGDTADTLIVCDITLIADDAGVSTALFVGGTLRNTCSYPSNEPNSDPSDCVVVTNIDTSIATDPSGTTTWSATLNDTATMDPLDATGSVVFKLWSDSSCTILVWETGSVNLVDGVASSADASTTVTGTNVITNDTVDTDGKYYWTVIYSPTGAFNPSSSACGEETTITPASVAG